MGEGRGGETMWLDKKGNFLCLLHYYRKTVKHEICVCLIKLHEIKISDKHTLATLQCVIICTWNYFSMLIMSSSSVILCEHEW